MAVEQECNKKIQELVDKKIITREQLYATKSKSHLLYLDKDIKKFDGISKIFNAKTLIIVVILFAVLRFFLHYVVIPNMR